MTTKMLRVIVVDDEQPSVNRLVSLIKDSGLAEVVGEFTKPLKALEFLKENSVDAVFLDIEMPDVGGIELANDIIDIQGAAEIIFVTAYNQYAVEAFRLNALDYVMKPVTAERLSETLARLCENKRTLEDNGKISVSCFGRFSVKANGADVKFRTEKAEELLALIIDKRGGFLSRSEIADTLWEDFEGDRAIIHFNTTLYYTKRALLKHGARITFTFDRGGYKTKLDNMDCDYLKFCDFYDKLKSFSAADIQDFENERDLFSGEYLAGKEYDWAAVKRLLLGEQYLEILIKTAAYYKSLGETQRAANTLKKGLLKEQLHREINYTLIEILIELNEYAAAEKYYLTYKNGLKKKLNQEPDKEFKKFFK